MSCGFCLKQRRLSLGSVPASFFRAELSVAKMAGVFALLIAVVPPRLKEWVYAGFAFNLVSAFIAHASIHDRAAAFAPSTITGVLWAFSYVFWRGLESARRQMSANHNL